MDELLTRLKQQVWVFSIIYMYVTVLFLIGRGSERIGSAIV